jgi:hypothetical protein
MNKLPILLLFSLTFVLKSCAQTAPEKTAGFEDYNSIESPIHKANIGKIKFSSNLYGKRKYTESDFISSFEIADNSNFNFIAYMDNSLTNYLHQLDTSLTADELVEKGNYQFSFYLDGDLVYSENLHYRAGSPSQKNSNTILYRPFLNTENYDSWSRFLWTRFYNSNSGKVASILETGTHLLKIEIKPYLKNEKIIVGDVIAKGEINIKLAEPDEVAEEKIAIQQIQPNSDWELS